MMFAQDKIQVPKTHKILTFAFTAMSSSLQMKNGCLSIANFAPPLGDQSILGPSSVALGVVSHRTKNMLCRIIFESILARSHINVVSVITVPRVWRLCTITQRQKVINLRIK
uniref:Uncharacterized protein n=1 Tax=Cacopsylla melanoneura TaxID=428564 RepID=A0A8D8Q9S8_9HEMI